MKIANLEVANSTYIKKYIKKEEFSMKSLDYMRQILPNEFNWNILNQLFEEDGVELNEVAEKYLRDTPWNTNIVIFKQLQGIEEESI